MKWFFALNEQSPNFDDYCRLIKVAVYTAYLNTSLQPYFIYDGQDNALTQWLSERDVQVIHHRSSFYPLLVELSETTRREWILNMGAGAFLRIDLPKILTERGMDDEYVLYTDIDVMFLKDIALSLEATCPLFAVAPEIDIQDNVNINTGVMLMNIPGLLRDYGKFHDFTSKFLLEFSGLDWDQTAYRTYYHMEWSSMNPLYNWKPYWGNEKNAKILHFHGLKPTVVDDARNDRLIGRAKDIAALSGDEYYRQVDIWQQYLHDADRPFGFTEIDVRNGERGKPPTLGNPEDDLKNQMIQQSQYAELCDDNGACDWRAVKGKLVLWILTDKKDLAEEIKAYHALSRFFFLLGFYQNAIFHARVAFTLNPHESASIIWLAELYFRQGSTTKAIKTLEDALIQKPDCLEVMVSLAKMYLVMHQYQTSAEYYMRAGVISPGNPEVEKGLRTIDELKASGYIPR